MLIFVHQRFPNDYIICLHDVSDTNEDYFAITPCLLRKFLKSCDASSFKHLDDMLIISKGVRNKSNRYAITFDDGLESVYTQVYPLMKEMGIPFTCYITTDYIDKEGFLSKEQIREISSDPLCEIGSHMVSHRWTREMSAEEIAAEWKESKNVLSHISGRNVAHAALPYGSLLACSRKSIRMAFNAGYITVANTAARPHIKGARILSRCTYSKKSDIVPSLYGIR